MKVTSRPDTTVITAKTTSKQPGVQAGKWWESKSKAERCSTLLATFNFLKTGQNYRFKQAAIYARMYGNMPLSNFVGSSLSGMDKMGGLPLDRPTFNLIQSCTDTLVSKISQSRPSPVFLTDNSDYKQRKLSKQLNQFILGELYQTKGYEKSTIILRDALVEGTGCLHVYPTQDNKVGLERVLLTELFTDANESLYGEPRQLYRMKLVDREVLREAFPGNNKEIDGAEKAYPDNSSDSSKSVSDLVMVVEAWHLPSGKDAKDGRHTIACSAGIILDEEYEKERFPFAFLHYSPRLLGFWAQGLAEQLMGTQIEINRLLVTISRSINLMGVPRVWLEKGSKVTKAHINNEIGMIGEYSGTLPTFQDGSSGIGADIYAQLQRLIDYGYQQSGISMLQASSTKPAGLNSGEAIRSYNDISTDRFATLNRRYDDFFIDLAYLITEQAMDIAKETGKYKTVYPNKDGTREIELPEMDLIENPFVIQCYSMSSLPKDPAGRMQKVAEMIQAGMISIKEGRRLLDYPDLSQMEKLANAAEERVFQILDEIVEEGEYAAPDPFMDLQQAKEHAVAYINLYGSTNLEEEKMEMLRTFFQQCNDMITSAQQAGAAQAASAQMAGQVPQAQAAPPPQSDLLPFAQ